MVKLNWTPQSKADLMAIADYIAKESEHYAKIQVRRIRERARKLRFFPKSGRVVPEYGDQNLRELVLGNYRIIYRVVDDRRIDIVTVHHSARILRLE